MRLVSVHSHPMRKVDAGERTGFVYIWLSVGYVFGEVLGRDKLCYGSLH